MDKNLEILIVDDHEAFRKLVQCTFEENKYSCFQEAESGEEAVGKLERGYKPNLIIMDTHMLGKKGYEICEEIKNSKQGGEIKVIGVSEFDTLAFWLKAKADHFLSKRLIANYSQSLVAAAEGLIYKKYSPMPEEIRKDFLPELNCFMEEWINETPNFSRKEFIQFSGYFSKLEKLFFGDVSEICKNELAMEYGLVRNFLVRYNGYNGFKNLVYLEEARRRFSEIQGLKREL